MFNFMELYRESRRVWRILEEHEEGLEYYKKYINSEKSKDNNLDKINYYESGIKKIENLTKNVLEQYPGARGVTDLLYILNKENYEFIHPANRFISTFLNRCINYTGMNKLSMIYLRDTFYIESVYKAVKDTVDGLSISLISDGIDDDGFEYSVNNLISELGKLDLQEPVDINKVRYISEIYLMIFVLLEYYKTHEVDINDYDE